MPNRNISLTPEQDEFIEKAVQAGEYQNASEAVRDALRTQIKAGVDALERREFVEVDESDLDGYLQGLTAGKGAR